VLKSNNFSKNMDKLKKSIANCVVELFLYLSL